MTVNAYDPLTGFGLAPPVPYGSFIFTDAQITGTAEGANTQGVATGLVAFNDSNQTFASCEVNSSNLASCPTTLLPAGVHHIVASYSGDPSYNPSTSAPVDFTISPLATATTGNANLSPVAPGQTTLVSATVTAPWSPGLGPTGSVTLSANNTTLATIDSLSLNVILSNSGFEYQLAGYGSVDASQLANGLNTLTVAYAGDNNYTPSSSTVQVDNVGAGGGPLVAAPDTITVGSGSTAIIPLSLSSSGGYTGFVNWGCYPSPSTAPVSCTIFTSHVPLSGSIDALMLVAATGTSGAYTLNIGGSDMSNPAIQIAKTVTVNLAGAATPSLALVNDGTFVVAPGSSTGNTSFVSLVPSGGLTGQVNFSCAVTTGIANPQSAPTCSVPSSVALNGNNPVVASVQVDTTSATTSGSYSVAVTATAASASTATATSSVPVVVTAADSFALASSGVVSMSPGASLSNAASITITPLNGFTGTVDLLCFVEPTFSTSAILPQCSVPATATLAPGTASTVNVGVTSDANSATGFYVIGIAAIDPTSGAFGIDNTIDLLLIGQPSIAISNGGSIVMTAGAASNNTSTITVAPGNGFTGAVNLACSVSTSIANPVDLPGCSLSPTSVNITGAGSQTSVLSVSTTARTSGVLVRPSRLSPFGVVLAIVLLLGIPAKRRAWARLLGVLVLLVWMAVPGCGGSVNSGGGGGSTGTTAGTYSVKVTGTDSTGKITAQTTISLTVN